MWNRINPKNDKNDNGLPDDLDKAIISYAIWEFAKIVLLILAVYSILKLLGKV